ncbi:MAG: ParB/RepB/Spo0J family partition protein [Candidatus Cloacimonetes bacterium]|nr:ParB/RepB/Spo0J family partition protein [Candidatus Cloacimonadota bacterium]
MSTRLGRGLDALIPTGDESIDRSTRITTVKINKIKPNPYQPRMNIDQEKLQELANSLIESGMIQPIIVNKKEDSEYELIAGERRLEAAKLAGFTEVPVIIRSVSPKEQLQYALIENIQRENLNPIEEAKAYEQLQKQFKLTHNDIAKYVGKDRSTVTNSIRLLKLEPTVQEAIVQERLTQGHARVLLQLKPSEQLSFAKDIIHKQLSVRQTEVKISNYIAGRKIGKKDVNEDKKKYYAKITDSLQKSFTLPVKINPKSEGGSITFTFKSDEQFQKLIKRLLNKK